MIQNLNSIAPNTQVQKKSPDIETNLYKSGGDDSDIHINCYEAPGLKKQQSDMTYDLRRNQLKSVAPRQCKYHQNNLQNLGSNSGQNAQADSKGQQKYQNDEQISIIKFDDQQEELKGIMNQLDEIDLKLEAQRKLHQDFYKHINEGDQSRGNQQSPHIEVNEQKQNENTTCLICGCDDENLVKKLRCEHRFCLYCYFNYLNDKIRNAQVMNILCPQQGCRETFQDSVIQNIVTQETFRKYLNFKYKNEIQKDPNKKWCPVPDCQYYVERNPRSNITICKCGAQICFNCGRLAHLNRRCENYSDLQFQYAQNIYNIKQCPDCSSPVEKNQGCNHMTCRCGYQYCWVCMQKYHAYHYKYWSIRGCASKYTALSKVWANGIFKTRKVIEHPDLMRRVFFFPRLILFLLRGPWLLLKLLFKAFKKSISQPFMKLNKKFSRTRKPRSRCGRKLYFIWGEFWIVILVIIIFPFYFLFYRLIIEIKRLIKDGCGY
ncbi:unnamed protein product (macronuclear) [Paramecium tetraurelia]|uniref:RBR-type E3 ubiquitin transferase n=1 Tax=Paramecium tetraurelia TaxID=5888 RepID=A0BZF1_PARTE|nr:uncharacterized protein GSPATT00033771001 [Paramecium tetraurelia]CAK63918.1 unnamed protein product [Paramecium tetraurelia]|eukprot:XP_001431316.1 hypothetical protein (macronuclear) [Paramecium tetraurelia strain d4-2]